jgi:hypothetical protein
MTTPYTVSRKDAAERLKISVRTLDRYIRRGQFDVKRVNRQVWISQPSFQRYYSEMGRLDTVQSTPVETKKTEAETPTPMTAETIEAIEAIEVSETDVHESRMDTRVDTQQSASRSDSSRSTRQSSRQADPIRLSSHEHDYNQLQPASIYKSLYEELKEKHDEQLKRLEGAHYRVGQLEAQVKQMVPMLEYKKERKRLMLMDKEYKTSIKDAQVKVLKSKKLVASERYNKNVYIALVYGLLAVHSIFWLISQ